MASRVIPALALVLVAALAGCTSADVRASNFVLTPDSIGWNVGEQASFTLDVKASFTVKSPEYTVDPDFAIAELALERQGLGFGGYSTKDSADVDLYLERNGSRVDEAQLDAVTSNVTVKLTLPEKLADAEYVLELRLFEVGWVESAPFRVNVP